MISLWLIGMIEAFLLNLGSTRLKSASRDKTQGYAHPAPASRLDIELRHATDAPKNGFCQHGMI